MTFSYADAFSDDYLTARKRFRDAARALGCQLETHPIESRGPDGEELSLDVAVFGAVNPKKVAIVSSGLHGVEGFFGSAVQISLLEGRLKLWQPPAEGAIVLIHALNPYGFAWRRRCNEDNADLNRNFLLPGEDYQGSPEYYPKLDRFFNPKSPPSQFDFFLPKAIALALRYGMRTLKNTLPVGQYDFPQGLFYGGDRPSQTHKILAAHLPRWISNATGVLHLDFHTGLGKKGTYKLLLGESSKPERVKWLTSQFGADVVEISQPGGTSYRTRGNLGGWCRATFPQCNYDFLLAEFGTYPVFQTVEALRAENRAHWWGEVGSQSYERTKQRLVEVFIPADRGWRENVVTLGLELVQRAFQVCFESPRSRNH